MVLDRMRDWVAGSFWILPATMVLAFSMLALVLTWADSALWSAGVRFAFAGGPDTARSLISAIASSTLTLAGLSFSVTLVVLVLTSSQYSPRVLRTFLRDRRSKLALGVFLGTYVYALVALRAVRGAESTPVGNDAFVPGVATTGSFVLALAAIGVFVMFIDHVVQSVRVENIIGRIAADTRRVLDRVHPPDAAPVAAGAAPGGLVTTAVDDPPAAGGSTLEIPAPRPGVVSSIDIDELVEMAREAGVVVAVRRGVGEFVPHGAPLLTLVGSDDVDEDTFVRLITLSETRTLTQDVAFGFRQLVDIAERALSPGVNDPTTAVQALDHLHDLLRRLAVRPLHDGHHADDSGTVRVQVPTKSWADYVGLALDEVRHWGAGSLQVHQRLRVLIDDLLTVVDGDRADVLRMQLDLLDARAEDELPQAERQGV